MNPYSAFSEPTIRFCEANLNGWIRQPANAWSSLVISLAGVYILWCKHHGHARWIGWSAVLVGFASFAYHASFTFVGQLADLGSMFLFASLVIALSLRDRKMPAWATLGIIAAGTLTPLAFTAGLRTIGGFNLGIPLFAGLVILALTLEMQTSKRLGQARMHLWLALTILLAGWGIWWLDLTAIWCDPLTAHLINGHMLWHLSNAGAILLLDRYYAGGKA